MFKSVLRQLVDFFKSGSDKSVFAICFLLSTLFWFLIKFSKEYTYYVKYPVVFVHQPIDKYLKESPPTEVTVKVKAYGFNFLKNVFSSQQLEVDVSKLPHSKSVYYWLTESDRAEMAQGLTGFSVLDVEPDTLFLKYSSKTKKLVDVRVDKQLTYKENYIQHGSFKIQPSQIEVYGPAHLLDTLRYIYSDPLVLNEVREDIVMDLRLNMPHELLSSRESSVQVTQAVARYTQITKEIDIRVINLPPKEDYYLKPDKVELSYWVAMSDVGKLSEKDFVVYCDYQELRMTDKSLLNVFVDEDAIPSIAKRVQFYPSLTEFISKD